MLSLDLVHGTGFQAAVRFDFLLIQLSSTHTTRLMAEAFSLPEDSPLGVILEAGFFYSEDVILGQHLQEMESDGISLASPRGLKFYSINVLKHPVSIQKAFPLGTASDHHSEFDLSSTPHSNDRPWGSTGLSGLR